MQIYDVQGERQSVRASSFSCCFFAALCHVRCFRPEIHAEMHSKSDILLSESGAGRNGGQKNLPDLPVREHEDIGIQMNQYTQISEIQVS